MSYDSGDLTTALSNYEAAGPATTDVNTVINKCNSLEPALMSILDQVKVPDYSLVPITRNRCSIVAAQRYDIVHNPVLLIGEYPTAWTAFAGSFPVSIVNLNNSFGTAGVTPGGIWLIVLVIPAGTNNCLVQLDIGAASGKFAETYTAPTISHQYYTDIQVLRTSDYPLTFTLSASCVDFAYPISLPWVRLVAVPLAVPFTTLPV